MSERGQSREKSRVLVVDDDIYLLAAIHQTLTMHGYEADTVDKPAEGLDHVEKDSYMAVIADIKMPHMDGLELLARLKEIDLELPVIMMTGHGDVAMAVTAMKNGAYDFLEKPVDEAVMLASLGRAIEKRRLVLENRNLTERLMLTREGRTRFHHLIGRHPLMQRVYDTIEVVAREDDPVLVYGETGTGKELVARAIHDISDRRDKPFVAVNMAAIPGDMLESELFGYEKGAFTGAIQNKIGKFEFAGDGTLFLDEICSLPIHLQAKLLRVLEDRAITRLGSNLPIPVRARIITATNKDLNAEIQKGTFREDLYFRLNVLPIEIAPLRERRSDIPVLVRYFWEEYCQSRKQDSKPLDAETMDQIVRNDWPGNVRELRNYIRRLCIYDAHTATEQRPEEQKDQRESSPPGHLALKDVMAEMERKYLIKVLTEYGGRISLAHQALGISRKCLYDKINKYGVNIDSLRNAGKQTTDRTA